MTAKTTATKISAQDVKRGMVIEANGKRINVENITEDFTTSTFAGFGDSATINYHDTVTVLGHFNLG